MSSEQHIKINNDSYKVIQSYTNYRVEDSFIHRSNKLSEFTGNGESKKHVGSYANENGQRLSEFYNYNKWGTPHKDSNGQKTIESAIKHSAVISARCFFTKSNLIKYLETAQEEYIAQEQQYHNDINSYYNDRLNELKGLGSEVLMFTIYDASDDLDKRQNRGYIRSDDPIWSIWRKLVLPKISYLSISKIEKVGKDKEPFYYFKLFLDYEFRSFVHPSLMLTASESQTQYSQIVRTNNRPYSQELFKKNVHEHMPQCPFTKITDERLLTASHIKPNAQCLKENKIIEAEDYLNGLSLAPTYDRLFDKGYITFSNEGHLICGTEISNYSWGKLYINPNSYKKYNIMPRGREDYLEFHRNEVFLGNIEEHLF